MASQHPQIIPIIDFGPILASSDPEEWTDAVHGLDSALSSIGFVYLINHGVPAEKIQDAFKVAKTFFSLPKEVKALYTKRFSTARDKSDGSDMAAADYNGYVPAGDELLGETSVHEIRESFDIMGAQEGRIFPSEVHVPNFKSTIESLRKHYIELTLKLGQALGLVLLGSKPGQLNYFHDRLQALKNPSVPGLNQVRLLYYPEISVEATTSFGDGTGITRCFEHSDYGMITFLAQDGVGGLEVKDVHGNWVPAPPVEGALLLNTGDLLQFWSDGHYPATKHRVRIPANPLNETVHAPTRQSIAFFVNPDDQVNVAPLKTRYSEEGVREAEEQVNALDYVMQKLKIAYTIGPKTSGSEAKGTTSDASQ